MVEYFEFSKKVLDKFLLKLGVYGVGYVIYKCKFYVNIVDDFMIFGF